MILKAKNVEIKPWSFAKKVLIVFILFNLVLIGPMIEDVYGPYTPFQGLTTVVLPFLVNFFALLTICLLAAYDWLKLKITQAEQKSSNE